MEKGLELSKRQLQAIITQVQTFLDMHQVISAGPFLYAFMEEVSHYKHFLNPFKTNGISIKLHTIKAGWSIVYIEESKIIVIPPLYEVYRGYIVFAFSLTMLVCLSVCLSVCKPFFRSRISQKLFDLGLCNLVQTSGMTSRTVY